MDSLCRVRNIIMYVLLWRTVYALTRVLFWCLFPCATREINTKITLEWAHKQFATRVHTLFYIYDVIIALFVGSVFYPTLGCDIQGFRAMGFSVQYWPGWFQDFPAIWLAVPFGANGAHLGICTLPEKNLLCVWNKLFLVEIKFSQGELVLWSMYGDKLSLCRNKQMNRKI